MSLEMIGHEGLDEVVVVGFGTQKKENLTGAVASINIGKEAESRPITSLSAGLAGLAALREYRAAFARTLHLIADPGHDPLLFHCTAGKDRTGWMAAIVLTALDVPREQVLADYLATNDYVWPSYRAWLTRAAESGQVRDPAAMRELLYQDPSYIGEAFAAVESGYGTFDRFLTDGLDFGPAQVERLRAALLE